MITELTRVHIYREWISSGIMHHKTLGYMTLEREVFEGKTISVRVIDIDGSPVNTVWSEVLISEFFPDFTGYQYLSNS